MKHPDDQDSGRAAMHGLSGYQAAISSAYAPLIMQSEHRRNSHIWSVRTQDLGSVGLSEVFSDGPVHARPSGVRHPEDRKIILMSVEEGSFELSQHGHHALCGEGMMLLMNVGVPLEIQQSGSVSLLSLTIPTRILAAQYPQIQEACACAVHAAEGAPAVLRDLLRSVWRERDGVKSQETRALSGALINLVGCTFGQDARPLSRQPDLDALRERIQRVVDHELSNPELCPSLIAERLGISSSYLFVLARRLGTTIGHQIINSRLDQCHQVLADSAWSQKTITDIAHTWGFQDLPHFSRRFRERFGLSPKAFRESVR